MNTYKVILLGYVNAGKSSITNRYIYGTFEKSMTATIGASYYSKQLETNFGKILLNLWDCGGNRCCDSLMPMYFKNAHIILIVYDITSRQSFNQVNHYLKKIRLHTDNIKIILVGNKIDLAEQREITIQEAQTFANEHE